jgi:hypothetical protein
MVARVGAKEETSAALLSKTPLELLQVRIGKRFAAVHFGRFFAKEFGFHKRKIDDRVGREQRHAFARAFEGQIRTVNGESFPD